MRINILPPRVFNRISAGEVVEKPASIVKEMVENSIDAGATSIIIEIEDGGKKRICISDNGCGIEKEDLKNAFLPHATSKVKEISDLDKIETLGFRGEALASISSVCHTFLSSKTAQDEVGHCIEVNGGVIGEIKEIARLEGTTIEARDLFFNTPARAKFMRKSKLEESEITHVVQRFMLANPQISFLYMIDGKQVYNTKSSELSDIIYTIYGKEVYENILPVDYKELDLHVKGVVIAPRVSKSNRTYQTLFVNGRYVENYLVSNAIQGIYESFLMKGKFPVYVLNLIIDAQDIDVNVHPTKKEVKFENSNKIFGFVRRAVEDALKKANHIGSLLEPSDEQDIMSIDDEVDLGSEFNKEGFSHTQIFNLENVGKNEGSSYKKHNNLVKEHITLTGKKFDRDYLTKDIMARKELSDKIESNTIKEAEIKADMKIDDKIGFFKDFRTSDIPGSKIGGPYYFDQKRSQNVANLQAIRNSQEMLKQSKMDEIKIIGAIFNTYLIVELEDSVFFIDQHASHERTLYDKLVKQVDSEELIRQDLLVPYSFTVSPIEVEIIEKNMNALKTLGFELMPIGELNYAVISLPLLLSNISLKDFIDNLLADGIILSSQPSDILKDKLAQTACKHAIKGGDPLSREQILYIIEEMKKGVLLCPHGRPIVLEMTKKDLEKLFKRIV